METRSYKNKGVTQSNSLDLLQHNSNTEAPREAPCKGARYTLSGSKSEEGYYPHLKIFCKTYRCEYCGPRKIWLIKKAIEIAIEKYKLNVFATLTLDPKTLKGEDSTKYIRRTWNKFRILQKRQFEKNVDFVCVVELQKSGIAHLHVLFNHFLPHAWLKNRWMSVGGGSIVDIRAADANAAAYMSKYLTKALQTDSDRKSRKISTSQSIRLMQLLQKLDKNNDFYFCKVADLEARNILGKYFVEDILDKKGFIRGFKSTKRLPAPLEHTYLRSEK